MDIKNKVWKYVTTIVMVFIILNPELIDLAIFIDAVGLDILLLLFEVQILAILGALVNTTVRPIFTCIKLFIEKHLLGVSWKSIKNDPALLVFSVPSQAALMHMLVLSAFISIALNTVF